VKHTSSLTRPSVPFPFHSFRNITGPEDTDNGRKIFTGIAPATSFLALSTDENVRDYLLDAEGKKRRRPTQVNREIRETLENRPDAFSLLNGGIVIVARDHEVDESAKRLMLLKPSIINGSQTQGVLCDFYNSLKEQRIEPPSVHCKFELVVCDDEALIADISIARNFQNDVAALSIAGRRGQLEELEESIQRSIPNAKLRKSETQLSEEYISTERLLQVITTLIPEDLWPKESERENPNKVYTYSMKAKCLKDFQELWKKAKDPNNPEHSQAIELYQFFLDIAPQAYQLHEKWKAHQGFQGTGLRAIEREGRAIVEVPDGIVFPILASLSSFAAKTRAGWKIAPPKSFRDDELIRAAKAVYQSVANSNPWVMGKSRACYASLYQITSIYKRLSDAAS
jgi:AIPR protein